MTCATGKWTDSCTSASRLDRIMHMTKPGESEIMEYIIIYVEHLDMDVY